MATRLLARGLRGWASRLAWGAACGLGMLASADAVAGAPAYFTTNCLNSGCHNNPPRISSAQDARSGQIIQVSDPTLLDTDTHFVQRLKAQGVTQMTTLANDATQRAAIRSYLIGVRDGAIASTSLGFGTSVAINGSTAPQTDVLTNDRYLAATFSISKGGSFPSDFSVSGCSLNAAGQNGSVPGNSTCTLSVAFSPQPGSTVSRTATLTVVYASNDGGNPVSRVVTVSGTADLPPTANAGADQPNVVTGGTVSVTGQVTDPNGLGQVSTSWTVVQFPGGSAPSLSGSGLSRSFVASSSGLYRLRFSASDAHTTVSDTVDVIADARPVAVVAAVSPVTVPATVTLDGSGSFDPDPSDTVSGFVWDVRRNGNPVSLNLADPKHPTFVATSGGNYTASLQVSDGRLTSNNASTVSFNANTPPIANAGQPQSVTTTTPVHLNGGASSDPDGDPIVSYAWTLEVPPTSAATLTGANTKTPSFTPDIAGTYKATLVVNDGKINSSPSAPVLITASVGNAPPIAQATASPNPTTVGSTVQLDGSPSSDFDGNPLTYAWTLTKPTPGSSAALSSATSKTPTFVPDVVGTYVVSLTVNDGTVNSASPFVFNVVVTLSPPALSLSATTLPLAAVANASTTASAVITNTGGAPLVLGALVITGPQASEFALAPGNACTPALSIAAGSTCTLVVSFSPLAAGARSGTLSIASNAPGSPHLVTLQGNASSAPQGRIELSALTLTFDDTTVADSSTKTLTVHNGGNLALNFSAFTLAGAAASDYALGGDCAAGVPLAVLADCTLVVTFHPAVAGQRIASLTIQSDASNGAATITLTGKGLPVPAPAVGLDPPVTLEFGSQTVSGLYPARQIVLSNTGNAALTIANVAVTGTAFALAPDSSCAATLAAGSTCVISIAFLAPAVGGFAGSVAVTSNAAGSPHVVALQGTGSAAAVPVLTWSPAASALDFGMVSSGTISATQSVFLKNAGPGGVQIYFANATGPDNVAFAVDPGTCPVNSPLFEGATCRIDVRFAPGSAGAKRGNLQVASSGSLPPPIALSGTGLSGPSPGLSPSVSSLDFGASMVGSTSLPVDITLKSDGSGIVNISAIDITGPYLVQSSTCPATPFSLSAGLACTLSIQFKPTGPGTATGTVVITSDASPSTRTISLTSRADTPAETSGGGCTIAGNESVFDPVLIAVALLALAMLGAREKRRRRTRRDDALAPNQDQPS